MISTSRSIILEFTVFQAKVIENQLKLLAEVEALKRLVLVAVKGSQEKDEHTWPLKSIDEFIACEEYLANQESFNKQVNPTFQINYADI